MDVYEELYELSHNFDDLFSEYGRKCNAYRELEEENKKLKKQLEMLQNPENVTENVANQKVQHCEKRIDE